MFYTIFGSSFDAESIDRKSLLVKKNPNSTNKVKYDVNKRSNDRLGTLMTKTIKGLEGNSDEKL